MIEQKEIAQIKKDERFEGFLLVRSADRRTGKTGAEYLDMNLCDRTGEINAKKWDNLTFTPLSGDVVKVRGSVVDYNGRLQLRVELMRTPTDGDDLDYSRLAPSAPRSSEDMLAEINETIRSVGNEKLKAITEAMVRRYTEKLTYYPAAQRIHHAERGGLLHHTTGMLALAKSVMNAYPYLNRDLLLCGVILHDLCKTEEMDSDGMGVVRDYSREGLLLGHLVLGVARIEESAKELGIQGEEVLLLEHMMLSHHGEAEFGSPRQPMFPEAEVLHWIDLLDARMNEMQGELSKVNPGAFTDKIRSLDRRLYRPSLTADAETVQEEN